MSESEIHAWIEGQVKRPSYEEMFGKPIQDQPPSVKTDEPYIQDLVMQDIEHRKQLGIERYGTLIQANNGRDHLVDAYQEAIDETFYLRAEIEKRNDLCQKAQNILALIAEKESGIQDHAAEVVAFLQSLLK